MNLVTHPGQKMTWLQLQIGVGRDAWVHRVIDDVATGTIGP